MQPLPRDNARFDFVLCCALCLLALALLSAIVYAAFSLEMGARLHLRYWAHAIPEVISQRYFGMRWDFTAFHGIVEILVNTVVRDILIPNPDATAALDAGERALRTARGAAGFDRSIVLIPFDDKGYADLTRLAFRLFGLHVPSILKAYLLLLSVSVAAYLMQFRNSLTALVILNLVLVGFYAGLFAFPLSKELGEVTNPRAIGMLSLVALSHIIFVLLRPGKLTRIGIIGVLIQTALIYFVFFCRSSESWQIFLVVTLALAYLARCYFRRKHVAQSASTTLAAFVAGAAILTFYQWVVFNPAYFKSHGQYRLTWHNIGIGFALHPDLATKFNLIIGDNGMFNIVAESARSRGLYERVFSGSDTILSNPIGDFALYDRLARDVVLEIIRDHPVETATLFAYYKPLEFMRTLAVASDMFVDSRRADSEARHITRPDRERLDAYLKFFRPLACAALLLIVAAMMMLTISDFAVVAAIIGLNFVGSLVPAMLSYPVYHIIGMSFASFSSLVYLMVSLVVWILVRVLTGRHPLLIFARRA